MVTLDRATLLKLIKFGTVGGLTFLVDAGITTALIHYEWSAFTARLVAIAIAMFIAWRLNRAFTFGASDTSQTREGGRYLLVALGAAAVNYVAYSALILLFPAIIPFIAVAFATGISMVVSYLGFSRFTFKADG